MKPRPHLTELLETGEGSDADVRVSLGDLRRINRHFGGRRVLRTLLDEQVQRMGLTGFSLLDVGAASGDLPAAVREWFPDAKVVAVDLYERHLRAAPEDGVRLVCADAWRLPFGARSFDFVSASLFLHHFSDDELPGMLRSLAAPGRRALVINDLDRHWALLAFVRLAGPLLARSPITRFDAPASIRQAFGPGELERAAARAGFHRFHSRWHWPFRRSLVVELN